DFAIEHCFRNPAPLVELLVRPLRAIPSPAGILADHGRAPFDSVAPGEALLGIAGGTAEHLHVDESTAGQEAAGELPALAVRGEVQPSVSSSTVLRATHRSRRR